MLCVCRRTMTQVTITLRWTISRRRRVPYARAHLPDHFADVRPVAPRLLHLLAPQLAVRLVGVRVRVVHVVEGEGAELQGIQAGLH